MGQKDRLPNSAQMDFSFLAGGFIAVDLGFAMGEHMNPLISIIVPIYNKENTLSVSVESLLAQTYTNLEIILVDDGSGDSSLNICQKYARMDSRVKIITQRNGGVSSARNAGLRIASGQYIGFMDGDDQVKSNMYQTLIGQILKYKVPMASCGFECAGQILAAGEGLMPAKQFLKRNIKYLNVWNKLFHRSLLKGLCFDEKLKYAEDFLFCFSAVLRADKVFAGSLPLYLYNKNVQSATNKSFNAAQLASLRAFRILQGKKEIQKDRSLYRALEMYKTYNMVGFLRSFIEHNYNCRTVIKFFIKNIRRNIFPYLFTPYPLLNRLFALSSAVNFNLTKKIYKVISRPKRIV